MFSTLRDRMGIPGVISVIALVFAMTGGAYAAKDVIGGKANSSAKGKQGKRGPKGPAGPAGVAGPTGPAGAAGAKGDKGDKGDTGAQGSQGAQGVPGQDGSPWTAGGTLPPEATLTGVWMVNAQGSSTPVPSVPLSFNIPLSEPLPAGDVHFVTQKEVKKQEGKTPPAGCQGSVTNPTAAEGHLCVYEENSFPAAGDLFGGGPIIGDPSLPLSPPPLGGFGIPQAGASVAGAVLTALVASEWKAYGTWAVTGE
jgi:Collagen triple helix repeat (20 copies)